MMAYTETEENCKQWQEEQLANAPPWWFDDFEEEYCQFCPDKDVCVIEPEEIEDDCQRFRGLTSKVKTE